jgi:hypothetical protein
VIDGVWRALKPGGCCVAEVLATVPPQMRPNVKREVEDMLRGTQEALP